MVSPSGSRSERRDHQPSLKRPPDHIALLFVRFQPSNSLLLRLTSFTIFVLNRGTFSQTQFPRCHPQAEERHSPLSPHVQASSAPLRPNGVLLLQPRWLPVPRARLPVLRDRPHPQPKSQTPGGQARSHHPQLEGH